MSVTFHDLDKRYEGFIRPFLKVSVDGAEDESRDVNIRRVELTLTCGYEAGACTFELTGKGNAFQNGELKLDPAVRKYLNLGTKLELSVGYIDGDHSESVFTGYVTAATLKLEGERIFHVIEAMDCKALMMNNSFSEVREGLKRDSEAVAGVLKAYGSAADSPEIEDTEERSVPIGRYAQSDYDFLVALSQRNNRLFFVDRDKVRFISDSGIQEVGVVLAPGRHLFRLERMAAMAGQVKSVTVRGRDTADPETRVEATAVQAGMVGGGKKTAAKACGLVGEEACLTLLDGSVQSTEQAKVRAESEWQRAAGGFITGSFETVGAPCLRPGTLVTLKGFDEGTDGDYLITEAVHKVDLNSYRAVCKFRRSRD